MIREARINRVLLNRAADLFFEGEYVFAPMGTVSAKDLAARLDYLGADRIMIEYRTVDDPIGKVRDAAKFSKRLTSLAGWTVGTWRNREIKGHVFNNVFECEISRNVPQGY